MGFLWYRVESSLEVPILQQMQEMGSLAFQKLLKHERANKIGQCDAHTTNSLSETSG